MNIFDPHISGSLSVSGSGEISGDLTVLGTLFATISGTSQNAVSASHAANYTLTSSFGAFTSSYTTGAFTGSFSGNGSGLYNIPASGVTGLNLTRIADGSATASISSANGLRVNSNTEITGALKLNKVNLGSSNIVDMTLTDGGGKYYINGVKNPRLSFIKGFKYRFYFNNNNTHPLLFSLTSDGEHNGGTTYTTGITTNLDPFYVEVDVTDATAATLYYWCDHHIGMGNAISVYSDFLHGQSNIGLINVDTTAFATTGSNNFTNIQRTSGSLVVTGSVDVSGSHNVTGSVNITGSITLNGQAIGTGKLDETTFQAYTSSNDGRLFAIENSTSSYNTFTNSIDTRIKNEMNEENVISGSIQVLITGTTGYSTFSSSVSSSIGELSSSVSTTTSGLSSSINSLSSSVEGVTSGLSSSITSLSSSVATTTSGLSSSIGNLSSSFSSTNDTQNSRLGSIESATSSLNTFTSSIGTTIKNKLNTESVISGSIQVLITGTTGYSTFSSSISTSIAALSSSISTSVDSLSSSLATTTSGLSSSIGSLSSSFSSTNDTQNNRLTSIETSTSSLNTFTGSINTTIKNRLNTEAVVSGSSQISITGTTGYSTFSSSVSTSIGALSSSVATTTSGITSNIESLSSSFSSTNDTQNGRLTSIETSTGSLNSFTSSINTTIKNKLNTESVISGSVQVLITGTTGYSTFSSSVSTSIGALSSSVGTAINGLSSSVATTTNGLSSSVATTTSGLTLSISSLSSSVATTTSGLSSSIGSLSSSVATTTLNQTNRLNSIEGKTGSYATTGSNVYIGNQTITGSLYISQDLIVGGSSSIQHISSSVLNIGDNIITVNTSNPTLRFGGLAVIDSGSSPQVSGSLLFDATENEWIFTHQNQSSVTSALLIMGPETYDDLGNEIHLTNNRLVKSTIDEHVGDSNITDTGTKVSINSNTEVTGTLKVTGNITSPNITAIETSTGSLNGFTSSLLAAVELTGSNLTVRGNLLVKGTTTNVNTSTLDVDNNLINLNGAGASNAGLRVKDTTGVSQLSGSLLWDATNDYWIAGQLGSEQRLVRETEFNTQVTRINNIETSTGSLNSFTSSINTTIKNKLNSDGVISGSVQVNHNTTTNYDANQHVDHTAVLISAGSGLSGGGTIAATRTLTLDTGSVHFAGGVKSKMNTDGVISGSSQVLSGTGIFSSSLQLPSGLISGSAQVISSLPSGTVSGSSQVLSGTGIWSGSAQLPSGVVSGSSQVLAGTTIHSGSFFNGISVVSGSAQISFNGITDKPALVSGSSQIAFLSIANIPAGLVSGSSQVLSGTGIWSGSAQLPSGVVSGSAQVISLLPSGTVSGSAQLTSTFVQKAGDTMTGQLIIGSTGIAGSATLKINTSTAASFIHTQENFSANMTAGQTAILVLGQAGSTKNSGYLGYNWSSLSSNSNYVSLGHWGADNLLRVYGDGTVYMGTVTTGVWNGTAIGDTYISSASNWNTAFNKRISSLGFTSSTVTITLADSSTVTASVPTFNQNTSGTAANITASSNTSLTSLANLATVGTITSGVWNGTAIANANLANSSFNVGTTSISLGRASASQTLTGVSIDGASATSPLLSASGGLTTQYGNGTIGYSYALNTATSGIFPVTDNSNCIITVNRHPDSYYSQLGFSSNGNLYYRSFSATAINTSQAWRTIIDSGNIGSQTVSNVSGTVAIANGGTGATSAAGARTNLGLVIGTDVLAQRTFGTAANNNTGDFAAFNAVHFVGTTSIAANRASGAQTLTGVSIDGNAATATSADQIDGVGFRNTGLNSAVAANTLDSNGMTYVTDVDGSTSNLTGNSTDGALYSQIYSSSWQHQIYGDYRTGIMYVRGKNNGTWVGWKRVALSSATTFSSVTSVTFTHNLGTANVTAQVFDTNGDMFFPSNIRISSTQVIVTFASSRSGRLVVTG